MNLVEFLKELSAQGVELWAEGEKLRYRGSKEVLTPTLLAKIKQHKAEILELLQQEAKTAYKTYPLSLGQRALWFLYQFAPESAVYNIPTAIRIRSRVDIPILKRAFQALIARHPMLRTTFTTQDDGEPLQEIHGYQELYFEETDASNWRWDELNQRVAEAYQRPFDLKTGPVLRVNLFTRSVQDYILLLTIHHIVFDGWSGWRLLVNELPLFYQAEQAGRAAELPPLQWQYTDYVQWQTERLAGPEGERLWAYWQKQLAGDLPVLNLPTDRPRPPVQTYRGTSHTFPLNQELTQRLKEFSKAEATTLYMTLLAAFQVLLHRYSGQVDILVGSLTAGRNKVEFANIVGYFVNPVVLRADMSGNPTFNAFLSQVRQTVLDALAHQEYPFALLVEKLLSVRDASRSPLFQVSFVLQKQSFGEFRSVSSDKTATKTDVRGFEPALFEITQQESEFDLTLEMVETKNSLVGVFKYNTDLFDATTITRMEKHFQTLLEGIVVLPEQHIDELPLLTKAEQQQLLIEWNDTATAAYPTDQCVHQLFETQVEKTPEAVAVVFEGQQLTYRELNIRANQLAHHLQALGVKPEVFVAICVERSLEMVYGLLGILKAGGAYVPLDPSYPIERLAFMLEDSQVLVLLTQQKLMAQLPTQKTHQVLCLDENWRIISKASTDNPVSRVQSNNLAYVIYTSGSTGKPKGVQITHQSLTNFLSSMRSSPRLTDQDILLAVTTISFDIAALELYLPLIVGARIVLVSRQVASDGIQLSDVLNRSGITVMQATPATWRLLLMVGWEGSSHLKILIGGEALPTELARQLLNNKSEQVWNLYGPTETTIWSMIYPVGVDSWVTQTLDLSESIGRPIANTQIYILDTKLQPVPIGVVGELYIGGVGLARGYLNRPDLTAEKFIPHPFSDNAGTHLYKTGDLARYLRDGNIEYLGRIDNQVKIRGFRVELGEIETVLNRHPAVRQTVVIESEVQPNDNRLIAYVVFARSDFQMSEESQETSTEHLSQWEHVWQENYSQSVATTDPKFNVVGWKSSYTGLPIPEEEMREWVDSTVKSILSLQPNCVLEIGCGSGLLLFRIAPFCRQYWGTDFSPVVLQQLEQLKRTVDNLNSVELFNRKADDFNDIEPESFDTLILNSVIQYFPNVTYLLDVLDKAIKAVKPGGYIFVGDVRSLPLLKAYHASVQLYQAADSLSRLELQQRVQQRMTQEEELVIEPSFFTAVKQHFPKLTNVQFQLKRGYHKNELTQFRYDVILQVGSTVSQNTVKIPWQDWHTHPFTLSTLRQQLVEEQPEIIGWQRVPNARLETEMKTLEWLANAAPTETIVQLRDTLSKYSQASIDPEALWKLTDELPYDVVIGWANTSADGRYDVLFKHRDGQLPITHYPLPIIDHPSPKKPWHHYANHPLQGKLNRKWVPQLRQFLQDQLPDYMVPSAFVVLEAIPLTPNGKIDRRALLALETFQGSQRDYVAPRTSTEETLAGIWMEVLGLEQVSVHDNFFELGGHSLLATQIISRIRNTFSVEVPLRRLFESPTVADLGKHIEVLCSEHHDKLPSITPVSRHEALPLSFAQQRLWFLDQLGNGSVAYNIPTVRHLTGPLHLVALEQSLTQIVQRHETLRTTFPMVNGTPTQKIHPLSVIRYPLFVINLQQLPPKQQSLEVQRLAGEEAQHPFNLAEGPLIRTTLLQLGQQEHILLLNTHHIISDGWSINVFIRELATFYEAFSKGHPSPVARLPIQYADFAYWQRQCLTGDVLQTQLNYWQQQLAGIPALLELPTDLPRPPIQRSRGRSHRFEINQEITQQLEKLGHQNGATLFMILFTTLVILLHRYSGQKDIVVGSPIANRNHSEIESLIGFFANTLILRTQLSGNLTVIGLLAQVKQVFLDAYAHQEIPFEQLVEVLQPERNLSYSPLFQVMFALQNVHKENLELSSLSISLLEEMEHVTAKFDLTLFMEESDHGLQGILEYNTDLFNADTISRMAGHFQTLLEGIVTHPTQSIKELPLLTKEEQQQLLIEWNNTEADYPSEKCIHQLFEAQVQKTPEAVAVMFEDQQLTYQALNTKANQVAHYLQTLGVKPEVLVGICVERSLDMVIGLFGILKSGGAYVPLDPAYPAARLAFMLEDANVAVLLTQSDLVNHLPQPKAQVVCLDTDWKTLSQLRSDNPISGIEPENLAYVIYTSGSTGKPKGAMNTHRGISNRLLWMQEAYQLTSVDRVLQKTPFSFDVSVWEFFWPLLVGARLVVAKPGGHQDSAYLIKLIAQQGITTLHFVPSMLQVFVQEPNLENCRSLKRVICSGEALPFELQERFFARLPSAVELHNLYGPTEAAVDVTYWQCQRESQGPIVPIGRPIANTQLYILDPQHNFVPIGVPGELHIGGVGLARGYFNRPELTADKFIPDPFSDDPKARLYKTGDLARYLPDGNVEYLSRIDNQVKIRGFRIELGEIEAVLNQNSMVRENAVIVHETSPTDKRLVAFIVANEGQVIDHNELRGFMTERLPDYMVPSTFVPLPAIPLTPNGKVDRRALAQLSMDNYQLSDNALVAPRTQEEELLTGIWASVLGLERVGIHDNFFELGGHSLLAVQLVSRVRDTFSIELPLQYLFESPTVAGLTKHIETINKIINPKRQAVTAHLSSDREKIEL